MILEKKFLFVGYRDWAFRAHYELNLSIPMVTSTDQLNEQLYSNDELRYIFFVGWSNIIEESIIHKYECFCIHPSALPFYRGGSPLQHQIMDGILDSGLTLFKMNSKLDAGPIFDQKYLSLRGSLEDIFHRISFLTAELIREFILKVENGDMIRLIEQDESKATLFKRRNPSQSEIKLDEFQNFTALQLYNKIRSLDDPYPNAFIKCSDGSKLIIKKVYIE